MIQFTCVVFCVVIVCLRSTYVAEAQNAFPVAAFVRFVEECSKDFGTTRDEMMAATAAGDLSSINPCFWGCYFKKLGILNDKGQYDLDTGLATYRKDIKNDEEFSRTETVAKQCELVKDIVVKDGEAGCERGALVAKCFMEKMRAVA